MIAALLTAAALLLPPIPGAFNPDVTQASITTTVCVKGYTKTIRPPVSFTGPLKYKLLVQQHLPGTVRDYQLDHMVSLELGGAPTSPRNLWMEPLAKAHRDDLFENALHRSLCSYSISLRQARMLEIAFKKVYG